MPLIRAASQALKFEAWPHAPPVLSRPNQPPALRDSRLWPPPVTHPLVVQVRHRLQQLPRDQLGAPWGQAEGVAVQLGAGVVLHVLEHLEGNGGRGRGWDTVGQGRTAVVQLQFPDACELAWRKRWMPLAREPRAVAGPQCMAVAEIESGKPMQCYGFRHHHHQAYIHKRHVSYQQP